MSHSASQGVATMPERSAWVDLLWLSAGQGRLLFLTVFATVLAQAGTVACLATGAWLTGMAITGAGASQLLPGLWLLGGAALVGAGGRWWQAHVSHEFAFALIETMQLGIYDGLGRSAPGHVLGHRTGELASIALSDAEMMENFFAHTLGDAIAGFLIPLLALVALALVQPLLTLALLPFLPLLASVPFWLGERAYKQGREMVAAASRLNAEVTEGIQGRRELVHFGQERTWMARLASSMKTLTTEQRRYGLRSDVEQVAIELVQVAAVVAVVAGAGASVQSGLLAPALAPFVVVLVSAALFPLAEVAYTARQLGALRAGAARILAIQRQPALVDDRGDQEPADASVRFEQVGFGYGKARGGVLDGVDFSVGAAEMVALVGGSGMGKSTCANLLLRFWDVDSGHIRIGGVDVRDIPIDRLRHWVAMVPQDVYLFDESIENNIRLGRPAASAEEVERAARMAQAHEFIVSLPQGYRTRCGERGAGLSGGQRQRIAIARALLCDAPILVLDEASSSIDAESEQALHVAMARLRKTRTLIVIAHRPTTIRQADRIVVLEDRRVVETGRHAELLTRQGAYARLLVQCGESTQLPAGSQTR